MDYIGTFLGLVDGVKLTLLMALIVGNFVTGIAVAIKTNTFALKKIGTFLYTRVLPYIVAYLGVAVVAVADPSWSWAVTAVWAVILATLVGAILTNIKELGINVPDILSDGRPQ